ASKNFELATKCVFKRVDWCPSSLFNVEFELHHLAVDHNVFLAFLADLASGAGFSHRACCVEVFEGDDFGLDEAFFKVGVNDTGSLRGGGALTDGPRAGFLRASGQVGLQAEGLETSSR